MEFRQKQAIYLQLADQVCEQILRQAWREGERIPSIREFAVSVEVNPNTVARTFAHLQALGVINTERGTGFSVAPGALEATRKLKRDAFLAQDVPDFFKAMRLLNVSWSELHARYEQQVTEAAASTVTTTTITSNY